LRGLENETGVGRGVLRRVFADGLKVAGVGNDGGEFPQRVEMTAHAFIKTQMRLRGNAGCTCRNVG